MELWAQIRMYKCNSHKSQDDKIHTFTSWNRHSHSLCKFVTEVDKVLSARGQILPQQRHCGIQVGLDCAHIGTVVAHSIQGLPWELHRLQAIGRRRCTYVKCKLMCTGIHTHTCIGAFTCWLVQSSCRWVVQDSVMHESCESTNSSTVSFAQHKHSYFSSLMFHVRHFTPSAFATIKKLLRVGQVLSCSQCNYCPNHWIASSSWETVPTPSCTWSCFRCYSWRTASGC